MVGVSAHELLERLPVTGLHATHERGVLVDRPASQNSKARA
jgi:hypothetical protein